ncbi:hypothetical protein REPUB_Repub19eG0063600 [Reevesia pubescens]
MSVGGVLFKVYIVGEAIKEVGRFSLPNVTKRPIFLAILSYQTCIYPSVSVAKPLVANGSAKSHELSLAYGCVLFKVYIVGEAIKEVGRFSLPNVTKRELSKIAGIFRFPRVYCAGASADDVDLDPSMAELLPRRLLEKLTKELRQRLVFWLFNLDIVREHGTRDHFYAIDVNYFPYKRHFYSISIMGIGKCLGMNIYLQTLWSPGAESIQEKIMLSNFLKTFRNQDVKR